jgi:hypothetical protein
VRLLDVFYTTLFNNYAQIVQRATKMYVGEPANLHIFYVEICRCVTMALTDQNPFGLTSIQSHTPFVPTGTDIACLAEDTGRFAEIDFKKT